MTETTGLSPRVVALVPAKMTSRRLPRKNMALLAGAPLFVHAVRVARRAAGIVDIFVSTESDDLAARAREEPCHLIRRPPRLSAPKTSNIEVMKHALDDMRRNGFEEPVLIVLLQPSHPFRVPDEIDLAISRMLADPAATSLISVAPVNNRARRYRQVLKKFARWGELLRQEYRLVVVGARPSERCVIDARGAGFRQSSRNPSERD